MVHHFFVGPLGVAAEATGAVDAAGVVGAVGAAGLSFVDETKSLSISSSFGAP